MYGWIWRHLPGPLVVRLFTAIALLITIVAVLLFVVFPWLEPQLPFNDVSV